MKDVVHVTTADRKVSTRVRQARRPVRPDVGDRGRNRVVPRRVGVGMMGGFGPTSTWPRCAPARTKVAVRARLRGEKKTSSRERPDRRRVHAAVPARDRGDATGMTTIEAGRNARAKTAPGGRMSQGVPRRPRGEWRVRCDRSRRANHRVKRPRSSRTRSSRSDPATEESRRLAPAVHRHGRVSTESRSCSIRRRGRRGAIRHGREQAGHPPPRSRAGRDFASRR